MKITPEKIAELRKLCEEATPEPWRTHDIFPKEFGYAQVFGPISPKKDFDRIELGLQADASFIAAARTALPELLDEVERLRTDINNLASIANHALDKGYLGDVPTLACLHQAIKNARRQK